MGVKTAATVTAAACVLLAGCDGSTEGTPSAASSSAGSSSAVVTPTAGVSPPTTAAPNPAVTGTSFDSCAMITDAEVSSWGLDPTSKVDVKGDAFASNVRGCKWNTAFGVDTWFLKVYAVNGSMADWEAPNPKFDRKERVQIGSRQGWTAHHAAEQSCAVALPSQQGVVAIQIDLGRKLELQHFDACPRAVQLATAIEPKIP